MNNHGLFFYVVFIFWILNIIPYRQIINTTNAGKVRIIELITIMLSKCMRKGRKIILKIINVIIYFRLMLAKVFD